ncbi:MAG: hypothetical protein DI533_05290 [Cereibacter sphaeroides]|uniref:Uncharacterized protein n=1 Tax=Cereibacter sphaeroides TaxID=1063 RepID=A0A2W5SGT9_CERSP|nr:MAG: hypothetical protein DI533_05290 [Cereibacter sphaeroides]
MSEIVSDYYPLILKRPIFRDLSSNAREGRIKALASVRTAVVVHSIHSDVPQTHEFDGLPTVQDLFEELGGSAVVTGFESRRTPSSERPNLWAAQAE